MGPYDVDGPDPQAEYELFQEDIDRLAPHIEAADRVPAFGEVGMKQVYNGAIAYTPDGNPIIGPAWDVDNFWLNEGHSFGMMQPVARVGSWPSGLSKVSRRLTCLASSQDVSVTMRPGLPR